jgi:hypothetical protein
MWVALMIWQNMILFNMWCDEYGKKLDKLDRIYKERNKERK